MVKRTDYAPDAISVLSLTLGKLLCALPFSSVECEALIPTFGVVEGTYWEKAWKRHRPMPKHAFVTPSATSVLLCALPRPFHWSFPLSLRIKLGNRAWFCTFCLEDFESVVSFEVLVVFQFWSLLHEVKGISCSFGIPKFGVISPRHSAWGPWKVEVQVASSCSHSCRSLGTWVVILAVFLAVYTYSSVLLLTPSLCMSFQGFMDLFPGTVRVGPTSILCCSRRFGPSPWSPLFKVCTLRCCPVLFWFNFCCWKTSWLLFFTSCCWESTICWSNFILPSFPRNLVVSFLKNKNKREKNKTFLDPTLALLPFHRVWNEAQVSPF